MLYMLWIFPTLCLSATVEKLRSIINKNVASGLKHKSTVCLFKPGSQSFPYAGRDQSFTVPSGIKELQVCFRIVIEMFRFVYITKSIPVSILHVDAFASHHSGM